MEHEAARPTLDVVVLLRVVDLDAEMWGLVLAVVLCPVPPLPDPGRYVKLR